MINEYNVKNYCCEDISLIENYEKAVNDTTQMWHCHHRLEIELNKNRLELMEMELYENRPANELIFLTKKDHMAIHKNYGNTKGKNNGMFGKHHSIESKNKLSKPRPKYKWLTPTGEIKIMTASGAAQHHKDWKRLEN